MAVGGPIKYANLGGRHFRVGGDNEVKLSLGGWTNEVSPCGDGGGIIVKSPKPGQANSIPLVIDDDRGDEAFIQELMNSHDWIKASFTDINDHVYSGDVAIVGDGETNKKTMIKEIDLKGTIVQQS